MSETIYVVTHNEDCGYTSYDVTDAIFSKKEYALHWVKQNPHECYEIHEHEIDQWLRGLAPIDPEHEVGLSYESSINLGSGQFSSWESRCPKETLRHPTKCEIQTDKYRESIVVSSPTSYEEARRFAAELFHKAVVEHFARQDMLRREIVELFPDAAVNVFTNDDTSLKRTWLVTIRRPDRQDVVIEWVFPRSYKLTSGPLSTVRESTGEVVAILKGLA